MMLLYSLTQSFAIGLASKNGSLGNGANLSLQITICLDPLSAKKQKGDLNVILSEVVGSVDHRHLQTDFEKIKSFHEVFVEPLVERGKQSNIEVIEVHLFSGDLNIDCLWRKSL